MSRKHEEWGTRVRDGYSYRVGLSQNLILLVTVSEVKKVTLTRFLFSFF